MVFRLARMRTLVGLGSVAIVVAVLFTIGSAAAMAGAIATLAIRLAAAGLAQDPAAIEANYVRRSDAELLYVAS